MDDKTHTHTNAATQPPISFEAVLNVLRHFKAKPAPPPRPAEFASGIDRAVLGPDKRAQKLEQAFEVVARAKDVFLHPETWEHTFVQQLRAAVGILHFETAFDPAAAKTCWHWHNAIPVGCVVAVAPDGTVAVLKLSGAPDTEG